MRIPGGRGLISQLQAALAAAHGRPHVCLSRAIHDQLFNLRVLATGLCQRPTRIAELVPSAPSFFGVCDAAHIGLGGVWLPNSHIAPIMWRFSTPPILAPLITTSENLGTITINDLELASSLAHADILAGITDVRKRTLAMFSDNVPAVTWNCKGSCTTSGPATYLLQNILLHQCAHRYVHQLTYLPGNQNRMANGTSRLHHLTDSEFLSYFYITYPQIFPWRLHHLTPDIISSLTSAMLQKQPNKPSLLNKPPPPPKFGHTPGSLSACASIWTPSYPLFQTKSQFS
ncbi:hypothetical protein ACA910_007457 [Epithemia clementina (nom. ined.)]